MKRLWLPLSIGVPEAVQEKLEPMVPALDARKVGEGDFFRL